MARIVVGFAVLESLTGPALAGAPGPAREFDGGPLGLAIAVLVLALIYWRGRRARKV